MTVPMRSCALGTFNDMKDLPPIKIFTRDVSFVPFSGAAAAISVCRAGGVAVQGLQQGQIIPAGFFIVFPYTGDVNP